MANEFSKRVVNGQNIWKCNTCGEEVSSSSKPRRHVCRMQDDLNEQFRTPRHGSSSAPNTPFPPPPNVNGTPSTTSGVTELSGMDGLYRFQMLQAEQQKQMMILMQQQNQEMMRAQQEQNKEIMRNQQEQNELKMNQMLEVLKMQKKETRIKCPKWEKDENIKNFISRLQKWNNVETNKSVIDDEDEEVNYNKNNYRSRSKSNQRID